MKMIFTCPKDHYWTGNMEDAGKKSTRICPECGQSCNLGVTGNGRPFEKAKKVILKTMKPAKPSVYVVAYKFDDDRNARRNEVGRELVWTVAQMEDVQRNIFADYCLNYETESNQPLESGNHAENYLLGI